MKFAYADPPYIGQAKRLYQCPEINHGQLIKDLEENYDGWALSISSPTLREVLNMCPDKVRVGAWIKPFHSLKGARPSYGWEPVIFKTPHTKKLKESPLPKDFVSCNILLQKGFIGGKPKDFCFWIFDILGIKPEDEFKDLFYGSGMVTKSYEEYISNYPEVLFRNLKPGPRKRFEKRIETGSQPAEKK
jgi:hypothetical protein